MTCPIILLHLLSHSDDGHLKKSFSGVFPLYVSASFFCCSLSLEAPLCRSINTFEKDVPTQPCFVHALVRASAGQTNRQTFAAGLQSSLPNLICKGIWKQINHDCTENIFIQFFFHICTFTVWSCVNISCQSFHTIPLKRGKVVIFLFFLKQTK